MINDIDFSFIRFRETFSDALDLNNSPLTQREYLGQIQLLPNDSYTQITNVPFDYDFSLVNSKYLVDCNGDEVEDVNLKVRLSSFVDSNGLNQGVFTLNLGDSEYNTRLLSLRIGNSNGNYLYSNLFKITDSDSEYTTKFYYTSDGYHDGTNYNGLYQHINLVVYFNNYVNQSEREEYYEISTNTNVQISNNSIIKSSYKLSNFNYFTMIRLESLITNETVYIQSDDDYVRATATDGIEYVNSELDSNILETDMLLSINQDDVLIP